MILTTHPRLPNRFRRLSRRWFENSYWTHGWTGILRAADRLLFHTLTKSLITATRCKDQDTAKIHSPHIQHQTDRLQDICICSGCVIPATVCGKGESG